MNTRRIPFQFSTTDPLARQRELERRFGLQPTCPKMYVDVNNPLTMVSNFKFKLLQCSLKKNDAI